MWNDMNKEKWQNILYAPLGWCLHLLALLPLGVLYVLSDALWVLVYHVLRYRRSVAWQNLRESFPDKSEAELHGIESRFYRNLTDYFFETIKLLHISDGEMRRRMEFVGVGEIDKALDKGQSVMVYSSHYGNWEWLTSFVMWTRYGTQGAIMAQVYRPLKNKWFDRLFLQLRSRYHTVSYPKNTVLRDMLRDMRDRQQPITICFISDQHPNVNAQDHVIEFLNHPTAMIKGPEIIARRLNMQVCVLDMERVGRGRFRCTARMIATAPKLMPDGSITDAYARILEARIKADPASWLWTHKRWKHKVQLPPQTQQQEDNNNEKESSCNNS